MVPAFKKILRQLVAIRYTVGQVTNVSVKSSVIGSLKYIHPIATKKVVVTQLCASWERSAFHAGICWAVRKKLHGQLINQHLPEGFVSKK